MIPNIPKKSKRLKKEKREEEILDLLENYYKNQKDAEAYLIDKEKIGKDLFLKLMDENYNPDDVSEEIIEVGAVAFVEYGCSLLGCRWGVVVYCGPAVVAPCYFVEQHHAAVVGGFFVYCMVEQPIVAVVIGDYFAVVAGCYPAAVCAEYGGVVVVEHLAACLAQIRA